MRPGTRILLVEDDRAIVGFIEPELERVGFLVRCAYDGVSGLEEAGNFGPALIVLDIMLPGLCGVGVLKRLREGGNRVPVIMLTARDTTLDKVHSLDRGADDYLTKPFDVEELLHPRGEERGEGDRANDPRVRAARVYGPESSPGALPRAPALARVGRGVRPYHQRGGCLRWLSQEKGGRPW